MAASSAYSDVSVVMDYSGFDRVVRARAKKERDDITHVIENLDVNRFELD
ncbi:MAG: hypothetical protein HWN51_02480 [Desulfobacterales bacterium]|nr:hypothetical protein [Desulfobacterales bacterium]